MLILFCAVFFVEYIIFRKRFSRSIKMLAQRQSILEKRLAELEGTREAVTPPLPASEPTPKTASISEPPPPPVKDTIPPEIHPLPPNNLVGARAGTPFKEILVGWVKKHPSILEFIKENWLGVVGALACVMGSVFFGITSGLFNHPEARVAAMVLFASLLVGISLKLKSREKWNLTCNLFKSTGGAIFLFATLGVGGIEGLQCIHSPILALAFLCAGIGVNLILAVLTSSQTIASLHVILSLIAFYVAPQAVLLLPLGAIVSIIGLVIAYRSKWDFHLILIIVAFTIQNVIWSKGLLLTPWMHYLSIGCSVAVAMAGAIVHYRIKYKSPKLEPLPFIAHLTNWGLLAWNVYSHAQFTRWSSLILLVAASLGFITARIARKKGILWLYHMDTLLSQLLVLVAIGSLYVFSIKTIDICLLALVEVVIFTIMNHLMKDKLLVRIGCFFQTAISLIILGLCITKLSFLSVDTDAFPLYWRMGITGLICWAVYAHAKVKGYTQDAPAYMLIGKENHPHAFSVIAVIGTFFFLGIYAFGSTSLAIQLISLSVLLGLGFWRSLKEDLTVNLAFINFLVAFHLLNTIRLLESGAVLSTPINYIGLILLDLFFVFGNRLTLKFWNRKIHDIVVYALCTQFTLIVFAFSRTVNSLVPAMVFLGAALLTLEIVCYVSRKWKMDQDIKAIVQESFSYCGVGFFFFFLWSFTTVHLQSQALWHTLSMRWTIEILGISVLGYWIAYAPEKTRAEKLAVGLVETLLGLLTLCIFAECSDYFRPLVWAILAIGLLCITNYFHSPRRLYIYSWIYLMGSVFHIAFITSSLTLPTLSLIESFNIPIFAAIFFQLVYTTLVHRKNFRGRIEELKVQDRFKARIRFLYTQPTITVLFPVFLGIALLLAYNYEKALLTLFWVGLTCLYLSLGLVAKSKWSIRMGMGILFACSVRLVVYDLTQSNTSVRAAIFLGVGLLMLCVSILYKKFKHRLETT